MSKPLCFLLCFFLLIGNVPFVNSQVFWLDGWSNRAAFTVTSNMNDFQGNLTHNLPASYLPSLRVTEDDGVTLIPVWNETTTIIWGRFPHANQTYYLYWGNSGAAAVWNSTAVFERVINSGVVLSLPMDEGSGTNVTDYSGEGNDLNAPNGVSWVTGRYFNSTKLDGANQYLNRVYEDSLNVTRITIAFWIKIGVLTANNDHIIRNGDYPDYMIVLQGGTDLVWGRINSAYSVFSNATLTQNEWCFVTAVYNGSRIQMYLNGTASGAANTDFSGDMTITDYGLMVGSYSGTSEYLNATIDELCILDYGMSDSEVFDMYQYYPMVSQYHLGSLFLREWWTGTVGALGEQESYSSSDDILAVGIIAFVIAIAALGYALLKKK